MDRLFSRRQNGALPFSPIIGVDPDEDGSTGPPSLGDLGDLTLYDEETNNDDGDKQAEGLVKTNGIRSADNRSSLEYEMAPNYDDEERLATATPPPESIVIPTKIFSIIILSFIVITHILLGHNCHAASKKLQKSIDKGELENHSFTTWIASPGQAINVRTTYHITSKIIAKFTAEEAQNMEFEVFGEPYNNGGTKRIHIISPVNGWGTGTANNGRHFLDRIYDDEEFLEEDSPDEFENEEEEVDEETTDVPFCPLFDAGYYTAYLSRYQYARGSLVVAQQFWNASQVLYYFLLICIYATMASPSFSLSSTTLKMKSTLIFVSENHKKIILWCSFTLLTIATIILLPFSVYFINPGGHALAVIMTITSLATIYSSPPNIRFDLADLPPRCFTPRHHPGVSMHQEKRNSMDQEWDSSLNDLYSFSPSPPAHAFIGANVNDATIIRGIGLCKVELIAFLCNLGSSMYNYNTSKDHVFPNWNKIFHTIDKWLGATGSDMKLNYEIPGRFMFNMGYKNYHLPLFMPLSFGSTTASYVFLIWWSILPFIYVFYFMSMYVMARRAPGVKIQRCLALFGVFHFLFLTDVVSYKYGRGLRNEKSEYCHWAERWAWRIAIVLPIYQNIFSGHYKDHQQRNRYIGPALHYFMMGWGIMFFVYQILLNDVVHFPQWLMGEKQRSVLSMMGFTSSYSYKIGYMGSLIVMVFVYGFMAFGGTWCHHLYVGP